MLPKPERIKQEDISNKSRRPTPEVEKELREGVLKRIEPLLRQLNAWQNESLSSSFRF